MSDKRRDTLIAFRVPAAYKRELEAIAKADHRSLSTLILIAIEQMLERKRKKED